MSTKRDFGNFKAAGWPISKWRLEDLLLYSARRDHMIRNVMQRSTSRARKSFTPDGWPMGVSNCGEGERCVHSMKRIHCLITDDNQFCSTCNRLSKLVEKAISEGFEGAVPERNTDSKSICIMWISTELEISREHLWRCFVVVADFSGVPL